MTKDEILFSRDDGSIADRHVEVLFRDLSLAMVEMDNEICVGNFNIYMGELFGAHTELTRLDDEEQLTEIIEHVFNEDPDEIHRIGKSGKHRIEYKQWGGKIAVESSNLPIALALSVIQHMRYAVSERFKGTKH